MATLTRAILDLDELVEPKNILIYGDTGTGKNILSAQLPGRVLVLSSEGGMMVMRRYLAKHDPQAVADKRFKVWPIRAWSDLEDAYLWVRENLEEFDWIVIDSITSVQNRSMRAAMEKAVRTNPEKRDIDLPDRPEHQKMQNAVKRMVTDFNELQINTLWLAQSMYREDRDGNEIVLPFIMGKDYEVSSFVCASVHAFGAYRKRPAKVMGKDGKARNVTERVLQFDSFTDNTGVNYWAKDRYQILPKSSVMAQGNKQVTNFGDLMASLDNEPEAAARAKVRVDEIDDTAEPEPAAKPQPLPGAAEGPEVAGFVESVLGSVEVKPKRHLTAVKPEPQNEPDPDPEPEPETDTGVKSEPEPEPEPDTAVADDIRQAAAAERADDPSTWSVEPEDEPVPSRTDELIASKKKGIGMAARAIGMDVTLLAGKTIEQAAQMVADAEQKFSVDNSEKDEPTTDPEPAAAPTQDGPKRFVADDDDDEEN